MAVAGRLVEELLLKEKWSEGSTDLKGQAESLSEMYTARRKGGSDCSVKQWFCVFETIPACQQ